MTILDGKSVANQIKEKLKEEIENLSIKPGLAVICIGDNPASNLYVKLKRKVCEEIGIHVEEYLFDNAIKQEEWGLLTLLHDILSYFPKMRNVALKMPPRLL